MFKVDVTDQLLRKLIDSCPPEITLGEIFQGAGATFSQETYPDTIIPTHLEFKEESDYVLFVMKFL